MTAVLLRGVFRHSILLYGVILSLSLAFGLLPATALAGEQAGGVVAWLASPIDPSRDHSVDFATSWHGRLMVLVWAVLFPAGILAARFFKIMPGQDWPRSLDNKRWWHTHLSTQYAGGILLLIAVTLALYATGTLQGAVVDSHYFLGWFVVFLAVWQFLGGWLRGTKGGPTDPGPDGSLRGDHYDMTQRRRVFEYAHKIGGYTALLAAFTAILTGLYTANAPRWMWVGLASWWSVFLCLAVWLQGKGFARDTYQAIWGPGDQHPGNRIRPIGLGIRRMGGPDGSDRAD